MPSDWDYFVNIWCSHDSPWLRFCFFLQPTWTDRKRSVRLHRFLAVPLKKVLGLIKRTEAFVFAWITGQIIPTYFLTNCSFAQILLSFCLPFGSLSKEWWLCTYFLTHEITVEPVEQSYSHLGFASDLATRFRGAIQSVWSLLFDNLDCESLTNFTGNKAWAFWSLQSATNCLKEYFQTVYIHQAGNYSGAFLFFCGSSNYWHLFYCTELHALLGSFLLFARFLIRLELINSGTFLLWLRGSSKPRWKSRGTTC